MHPGGMDKPTNVITGVLRGEPVAIGELTRLIMAVGLFLGWKLTESNVAEVLSAIGLLGSIVITVWARQRSTPVANPVVPMATVVVEGNDPSGQPTKEVVTVPDTKPVLTIGGWRDEPAS